MSLTAVLFLLGVLTGLTLSFARHPIFGLLTYVGVFYLHPPSRWWGVGWVGTIRWSFIAAGVTMLSILIHRDRLQSSGGLFQNRFMTGLLVFIVWLIFQAIWAYESEWQQEMIEYYIKFVLAIFLIFRCVDSERHLRWFMWAHVLGCGYFGWIAFTSYSGGRFEGFGGPGIGEANAGALQIVTGIMFGASLFLAGTWRGRATLLGVMPLLVNAVVTTISRSGFLSFGAGGLFFNLFTPKKFRKSVVGLSVVGAMLFLALTNQTYWSRIDSIKYRGEEVEGVDTGGGRLELIKIQWQMFLDRPWGCGHHCTTYLSPQYVPESMLTTGGQRASHNTLMSVLVDHGFVGAILYVMLAIWIFAQLRELARRLRGKEGFLPMVYPALAGSLSAVFIADQFVQYPKLEVRYWLISILLVLLRMTAPPSPGNNVR